MLFELSKGYDLVASGDIWFAPTRQFSLQIFELHKPAVLSTGDRDSPVDTRGGYRELTDDAIL